MPLIICSFSNNFYADVEDNRSDDGTICEQEGDNKDDGGTQRL